MQADSGDALAALIKSALETEMRLTKMDLFDVIGIVFAVTALCKVMVC